MPEFISSPNYAKGRLGRSIKRIKVHSTASSFGSALNTFKNPKKEKSIHFLIGHDGREVQMVELKNTAWHCGHWRAPFNNQDTIGIEHEGGTFPDGHNEHLGDAGYVASAKRIAQLHKDYGLGEPSSKTVVPHNSNVPTACPSGLDVNRLIAMAIEEYRPKVVEVPVVEEPLPPPPPPAPLFQEFLTNLSPSQTYNAEVSRMQSFLVHKGFLAPLQTHLGYYGPKTQAAVHAFQKANGITASSAFYGYWYNATRAKANQQLI